MNKNESSFSSLPTSHNSNELIKNVIIGNKQGEKKNNKKVRFKETVEIHSVESYKAHNKLFTYDEQEGLAEYYKEFHIVPFEQKKKGSGDAFFQQYNCSNPNITRRNVDPQCCCNII